MGKDGRVGDADQALVASDGAASVSTLSGFDPSRFAPRGYDGKPRHLPQVQRKELDALVKACRAHMDGLTAHRLKMLAKACYSVSPINCGWQQFGLAEVFVYEVTRRANEALAAATGTAKTAKPVECEASQSGPKGNAQ